MTSTITPVRVGGQVGHLFEAARGEGICFVPEVCVDFQGTRAVEINEAKYLLTGWARKNGLLNPDVPGHRLFPNAGALVHDLDTPVVAEFLRQLRRMQLG